MDADRKGHQGWLAASPLALAPHPTLSRDSARGRGLRFGLPRWIVRARPLAGSIRLRQQLHRVAGHRRCEIVESVEPGQAVDAGSASAAVRHLRQHAADRGDLPRVASTEGILIEVTLRCALAVMPHDDPVRIKLEYVVADDMIVPARGAGCKTLVVD